MKRLFTFLFLIPLIGISQDYQLDFNSATLDYVEMPNASSVITNKTEFTISGWVNPQIDNSHSRLISGAKRRAIFSLEAYCNHVNRV